MEKGEFTSAVTGLTKAVKVGTNDEVALEKVKSAFLSHRRRGDVREWNTLREEASKVLPEIVLRKLDASGFIHEFIF